MAVERLNHLNPWNVLQEFQELRVERPTAKPSSAVEDRSHHGCMIHDIGRQWSDVRRQWCFQGGLANCIAIPVGIPVGHWSCRSSWLS